MDNRLNRRRFDRPKFSGSLLNLAHLSSSSPYAAPLHQLLYLSIRVGSQWQLALSYLLWSRTIPED